LKRPMAIIREFLAPIIANAIVLREGRRQSGDTNDQGLSLVDQLVETTNDRKLVEDQLINTLLASRDTTASLLTFCLYCLALHPGILARLRSEVSTVMGIRRDMTKHDIRELKQCRAFINEVLRLFPTVPLNIRRTVRPALLPSTQGPPLFMPANTSIILATILMQRSSDTWGPSAEEFDIDRWLDGGLEEKERAAFMSWNIGPRMCLGQPFALTAAHTFLVLLFQHLDEESARCQADIGLRLVPEAQTAGCRMPESWKTAAGDGRARSARDRVWVAGDVILTIKGGLWIEQHPHDLKGEQGGVPTR